MEGASDGTEKTTREQEKQILEFAPVEENTLQEFAPVEEDGILEFAPDEEDGSGIYEDAGKKADYDIDILRKYGIDVDAGLNYCAGDESLYFEMLSDFIGTCEGKIAETDRLYQDENWHDYEVAAHALKSNVKMIGASFAYELAKELEEAAENGSTGFIKEHHERLISTVKDVADLIRSGGKARNNL